MSISPDPGGLFRSPLEYPPNSVVPVRIFLFRRDPINSQDSKNFKIRDMWINSENDDVWMLTSKTKTSGTWTQLSVGGAGGIFTLTGDTGDTVSSDAAGNISFVGSGGITITGDQGNNTLTFSLGVGGLAWTLDTTTPIAVNSGEGHLADGIGAITYNLPAICAIGDGFAFVDSRNGFIIQAGAGQQIRFGDLISSLGGDVTSTSIGDSIQLICERTDTNFVALYSVGNLDVN